MNVLRSGMRPAVRGQGTVARVIHDGLLLGSVLLLALGSNGAWALRNLSKQGQGVIVSGSAGLPDLQRGKQAAHEGRVAAAERDLVPLSQSGYVEAQLALGEMYEQQHTLADARKSAYWLEKALPSAENPVPAVADLIRIYVDYPQLDQHHHLPALAQRARSLDTPKTDDALLDWYRHTPDIKGHRQEALTLCRRSLSRAPDCYVDLIRDARRNRDDDTMKHYTHDALDGFKDGTVPPDVIASAAKALVDQIEMPTAQASPAPQPSQPTQAKPVAATPVAIAPGQGSCREQSVTPVQTGESDSATPTAAGARPDLANLLLGKLIAAGEADQVLAASVMVQAPYLAPDFDIEAALRHAAADHVPQAALLLGRLYLDGDRVTRQPHRSLHYLQMAAEEPDTKLEAYYFLGRLYQRGYLDEARPVQAAKYLLFAARHGYGSADGALARLFARGKGVCPNRVNAYVFATLGARDGGASVNALLDQLRAVLTPQQLAQANTLLVRERQLREHADTQFASRLNGAGNT